MDRNDNRLWTRHSSPPPRKSQGRCFLHFDVANAETGRFICSMRMPYTPLFKISLDEVLAFVLKKRPTLKYEKIVLELKYGELRQNFKYE